MDPNSPTSYPPKLPPCSSPSCLSFRLLLTTLSLFTGSLAQAQLTPPAGAAEWSHSGMDDLWENEENWLWLEAPGPQHWHAVFGNLAAGSAEQSVRINANHRLGSLWFEAGNFYTLRGAGKLKLGAGLHADGYVIAVLTTPGGAQSEISINNHIALVDSCTGDGGFLQLHNDSALGLRLGGALDLGSQNLRIVGRGATQIAGAISGTGKIVVGGGGADGGSGPQLILNAESVGWSGGFEVLAGGMLIANPYGARLGSGAKVVRAGGTLNLRYTREPEAIPVGSEPGQAQGAPIEVVGHGIVRVPGSPGIGAIYNDGGNIKLEHDIVMRGDTSFGSLAGNSLWIQGDISGSGSFIKVGTGLIILSGDNAWSGDTIIRGGALRLSPWSLPSGNLQLAGGVMDIDEKKWDFAKGLGTGAGQLQWTRSGGFSAGEQMGTKRVQIGDADLVLVWGAGGFVPTGSALLFNSRHSHGDIELANSIGLGNALREVHVARSDRGRAFATLSGKISGADFGGILKTGLGYLALGNAANNFGGPVLIREGALGGYVPNSSNIQLAGGVFMVGEGESFTRSIGSGAGQVQWLGSGGFASLAGKSKVRLNNSSDELAWDSFMPSGAELRLGHYTAAGTLIWDTALDLGDVERTIRVQRGSHLYAPADVAFERALSSGNRAALNFVGNGRIDLAADNAELRAGEINIYGVELRLHSDGRLAAASHRFDIWHGGQLHIDNEGSYQRGSTDGHYTANRIHDDAHIRLAAGTLLYRRSEKEQKSEKVGTLSLLSGANTIQLTGSSSLGYFELDAKVLLRSDASRSTLQFHAGLPGSRIRLAQMPTDFGVNDKYAWAAIIPWASTAAGWLRQDKRGGAHLIEALPDDFYYSGDWASWQARHNIRLAGTQAVASSRVINSLVLKGELKLNAGTQLTIGAGALLAKRDGDKWAEAAINGASGSSITTVKNRPLYIHNPWHLKLGGSVALKGGMDLVIAGPLSMIFDSDATHQVGAVYIHGGGLVLTRGTLSVGGLITVGDGSGSGSLHLAANRQNQIVNTDGGRASILLKGNPYNPDEWFLRGMGAALRLSGNTKLELASLHIEGQGVIDWRNGEVGGANMLWLDSLSFADANARLFMANWNEIEDVLLVRRSGIDLAALEKIVFDGYEASRTTWRDFDKDFIEITPFGKALPEPATCGALVAALGSGLLSWRRRKRW